MLTSLRCEDLVNVTGRVVYDELLLLAEGPLADQCLCDVCFQDIAAIAMNQMPPKYYNNVSDWVRVQWDYPDAIAMFRRHAHRKLLDAAKIVKERPHH